MSLNTDLGAISSVRSNADSIEWSKDQGVSLFAPCEIQSLKGIYENRLDLQAEDHRRIDLLYKI